MGILRVAVHLARLLPVKILSRIIVLDLTGKLGLELGGIKVGYQTGTTDTVNQTVPVFLQIVADGGQSPHPGNYYTPHLGVIR